MGGGRIQRKLEIFKGKQLAGKCTEPQRNNKEKGSESKTERVVISSRKKIKREMLAREWNTEKPQSSKYSQLEREMQFACWDNCDSKLVLQRLKRLSA